MPTATATSADLLTTTALAEELGLPRWTIRRWLDRGLLGVSVLRIQQARLIKREDLPQLRLALARVRPDAQPVGSEV